MKKNLLILLITLLVSCVTIKNGNSKTLKFVKAEKQAYVLGKEMKNGKTTGVTHSVYFDLKGKIVIKKVWIGTVNIDFDQVNTSETSIRVRSTFYGGTKSNQHPNVKLPFEYEGAALYEYVENSETKYYVLKEFKEYKKMEGAR